MSEGLDQEKDEEQDCGRLCQDHGLCQVVCQNEEDSSKGCKSGRGDGPFVFLFVFDTIVVLMDGSNGHV